MKIETIVEVNEDDGSGPMGTIESMTRRREKVETKNENDRDQRFFLVQNLPKCEKIKINNLSQFIYFRKKTKI
jgi:hypothetical protein